MKPQASRKLELTKEQLEAVARARARDESTKVEEDWLFVAEFGFYFGWEAIQTLRNDPNFSQDEANMLLAGARKVWCGHLYDHASATFYGAISAKSKRPNVVFKKLTKSLLEQAKADK